MNNKVLFKTVRNDTKLSKIKPVIIHVNYHPHKLPKMKAIVEYYVNGKQDALKPFPEGSECDSETTENDKTRGIGMADGLSSASRHGGLLSAWMGSSGQMSMADVVKMGRPQVKASMPNSSIHSGNHQNVLSPPAASHHNLHPLQSHAPKVPETNSDQGFILSQSVSQNNEWPSI
ncbi:hypothetical protein K1719_014352 [Acacia pycnantha]|nr:hypothetical protein K1719_014352 [Acacia pycnantha]